MLRKSSKFGVGKEIGGSVYVHRSSEHVYGQILVAAKNHLPNDFLYDVVKFNLRTQAISFVQCVDFDTATEPTVGEILTVARDGSIRRRKQSRNPEIYHHKWLFVDDDYEGFDVGQSKDRSFLLMSLDGIDRKRIGRSDYWITEVLPKIERLRDE